MNEKQLNKYREECVRISDSVINGSYEVLRMNNKPFSDGSKGKNFDSIKEAKEWVKRNNWKLWGYWEKLSLKNKKTRVKK